MPFATFTRRPVVLPDPKRLPAPSSPSSEAAGLCLSSTRRGCIRGEEEVRRWLDAAAGEDQHMTTAFLILQYHRAAAVRCSAAGLAALFGLGDPGTSARDRNLARRARSPDPARSPRPLERLRASLTIASHRGRPVPYHSFNRGVGQIQRAVDAQARDLRRTAMLHGRS